MMAMAAADCSCYRNEKHMTVALGRLAIAILVTAGSLPLALPAAQMYRCGNVYQDRPCEGAKPAVEVPSTGSKSKAPDGSAAGAGGPMHSTCSQRGVESQKIVWAREGGATEEKLLAGESDPARRQLIVDTYRVRGTAPQVRARIESECQVEMAEKAKAIAAHESMVKAGVLPSKAAPSTEPSPEQTGAEAKQKTELEEQRLAAAKTARCNGLNAQRDSIRDQQRKGGSGEYMDNLNRQRTQIDKQLRSAAC